MNATENESIIWARIQPIRKHSLVRDDGIVLKLEDDYQYDRVPLYKPPKPDIDMVYMGMQEILKKKVGVRSDLYMDYVVNEYINFITS